MMTVDEDDTVMKQDERTENTKHDLSNGETQIEKNQSVDELLEEADISQEKIEFVVKDISDKHLLENISTCSPAKSLQSSSSNNICKNFGERRRRVCSAAFRPYC